MIAATADATARALSFTVPDIAHRARVAIGA